jgi:Ca2+-binding RTX toxin-like protein
VYGGTGGNNLLIAGDGQTTLFGGGNGDQLYASGDQNQVLHAGRGNETLSGSFASGNNTFVAGTGSATITAGIGTDQFVFINGQAGGTELIQSFTQGDDQIDLEGYGRNQVNQALRQQQTTDGNTTITLSDNTTITFANIASLTADDFTTSSGNAAVNAVAGSGLGGISKASVASNLGNGSLGSPDRDGICNDGTHPVGHS